jgi:hypothetical protein
MKLCFSIVCNCIHDSNFTVRSQQWNSSTLFHDFTNWITVKPWNREIKWPAYWPAYAAKKFRSSENNEKSSR